MNHSCNVSWQFWSEADWAGAFKKEGGGKKGFSNYRKHTRPHGRAWQHLSVCLLAKQESGNLLSGTINVKHRNRVDTLKNISLVNSHERNGANDPLAILALYRRFCFFFGKTKNIKFSRVQLELLLSGIMRKRHPFMIQINRSTFISEVQNRSQTLQSSKRQRGKTDWSLQAQH